MVPLAVELIGLTSSMKSKHSLRVRQIEVWKRGDTVWRRFTARDEKTIFFNTYNYDCKMVVFIYLCKEYSWFHLNKVYEPIV